MVPWLRRFGMHVVIVCGFCITFFQQTDSVSPMESDVRQELTYGIITHPLLMAVCPNAVTGMIVKALTGQDLLELHHGDFVYEYV